MFSVFLKSAPAACLRPTEAGLLWSFVFCLQKQQQGEGQLSSQSPLLFQVVFLGLDIYSTVCSECTVFSERLQITS